MLQVSDIRHTKVYQEALEEGIEKGREESAETIARRLLMKKLPLEDIEEVTGLSLAAVKRLKKKRGK
jgi:predicted transposase/invertase (TIGR01784 family)